MRFNDTDFINAIEDVKNNLICRICALDSHNFISKDALVEIVRYQNEKIKELDARYTCQEDLKEWIIRNWFTIEECISNQLNKSMSGILNIVNQVDKDNLAESIANEIKDGIINVIDTYEVEDDK